MAFLRNISPGGPPDEVLVSRYRQTGDLNLLGELYQRYMDLVYGVALKYLKDPEKAQDTVMQLFEELVEKLRKHDVEQFRPWLHRVARNHCLMQLRTPRNLKTVEIHPDLMQSEEPLHLNSVLEKEAHLQQLARCLESLGERQRETVRLFYLEGKCYQEIAAETGQDWNQVRSQLQNGRRNLKICMETNETEPDQGS